ncbi:3-hydroxyanthranilate 3,4-dioxygenase [Decorospora gaudefroyi]|uniref:3-hydroxyanthranilate 3,4-dioxygenase n=1 Tax=Decorospora gaudefroyi TaxID=184978 RepID=A0A6A5K6B1_9PLEO|nr:3-hydroxyanthranilate 3,4-dioxygenase [Decorospora gaudefroyi]
MRSLRPAIRLAQRSTQPLLQTSGASSRRHFSQSRPRQQLSPPLNIPKWVAENSHMLKPPINNYCVYSDPLTVMIVGGPNERTDYHINSTPEWFYQHKGSMLLKVVDESLPQGQQFRDIHIHEGDMFLLPPNTPHNPVRFKDTVGVVLEQPRPEGSLDRLRWYCQSCGEQVHEAAFHCTDLGTQIKDAVNAFKADTKKRTCKNCGTVCDTAPQPKA